MEPVNFNSNQKLEVDATHTLKASKKITIDDKGIIHLPDGRRLRIARVTIEGKTIDFNNLDLSNKEFKAKVENEVTKILSQFSKENTLSKDDGSYKLSLFKEKVVLKSEKAQNVVVRETANLKLEKSTKYENSLTSMESQGLEIITKNEKMNLLKHSFTKKPMGPIKAISIRVAAVAFVILFSPLILTTFVLVNAAAYTYRAVKNESILTASSDLKRKTEENKWDALEKIYRSQINESKAGPENLSKIYFNALSFSSDSEKLGVLQDKTERHLIRAFKRSGVKYNAASYNKLKDNLTLSDFAVNENLKSKIRSIAPELNGILKDDDISIISHESKAAHTDTSKADQKKLKSLMKVFENPPANRTVANDTLIANLRAVIDSPTYQALKEHPENEYIKLVEKLSCGIWNKPKVLPAYQKFGKEVLENIDSYNNLNRDIDGKKMVTILNDSHHYLEKKLFTDHGILEKIIYAFTHPLKSLQAASSEGGLLREVSRAFGFGAFDPHGTANNNPSLQGVTKASIRDGRNTVNATINNCYGGSPTIGSRTETKIAPEYLALCQACENNQFATSKDNDIPSVIYYTSLQDIENIFHGDDERGFAVMELNEKYPLSFFGMTLAKDSDFYMMRGVYSNPEWDGVLNFGAQVFKQFESEKCYQYGDRTTGATGHGMYLPYGSKKWTPILAAIQNKANARFDEILKQNPLIEPNKLRGAYQEYVYSMIEAYTELEIAKEIAKRTGNHEPLVMTMKLCKGNLDRGGAENAKNCYTRLPLDSSNEELISLVLGSFEGRAITTCDRTILPDRLPQVLSFIEFVGRKEFQDDLLNLFNDPKINIVIDKAPAFTPALN